MINKQLKIPTSNLFMMINEVIQPGSYNFEKPVPMNSIKMLDVSSVSQANTKSQLAEHFKEVSAIEFDAEEFKDENITP